MSGPDQGPFTTQGADGGYAGVRAAARLARWLLPACSVLVVALVGAGALAAAAGNLGTTPLVQDEMPGGAAIDVVGQGLSKAPANLPGLGTSCATAVEAAPAPAMMRTPLGANAWVYRVDIRESELSAWEPGGYYRLQVYADGALVATLYAKNATDDGAALEGVAATVDLGLPPTTPVLPDSYATVLTALGTSCE